MKNLWWTLAALIVGLALAVIPAQAQNVTCNNINLVTGTYPNVTVPPGQFCEIILGENVTVTGNVSVGAGATFSIFESTVTIQGNLTLTNAFFETTATDLTVDGNITSTNATGFVLQPAVSEVVCPLCGGTIGGNVTVKGGSGFLDILSNTVAGNVSVINYNTASITPAIIGGNIVSGNLVCSGNNPAPINNGFRNTVS